MPRRPRTRKLKNNEEAQGAPATDDNAQQSDEQQAQDSGAGSADTLMRTYHSVDGSGDYAEVIERAGAVIAVAHIGDRKITFTPRDTRNPGSAARQTAAIIARKIAHISIQTREN